jgi:hypothetical protein
VSWRKWSESDHDAVYGVRPKSDVGVPLNNFEDVMAGDGEEEFGKRVPKKMSDPCKPKQEDIDEHNKSHLPYRN